MTTERVTRRLPAWVTALLVVASVLYYVLALSGSLPGWVVYGLDRLSNFAAVFLGIFIEAAPFLLLGTLASGVVEVFINRDDLARWIPRQPLAGALVGSLIGLFFPVCECGVVPFTRRLMQKGMPVSVGVATLLAAPVVNPIVIASTLAAFGPGLIFWGRLGFTLVIAVLSGVVFSMHARQETLLRDDHSTAHQDHPVVQIAPIPHAAQPAWIPWKDRLRKVFLVAADEFFEMGRYLVIGALLAALMQTFLRQSALLSIGQGPVLSVIVLVALAALLSICSTVDAFIALAFAGTFSSGAVLAFLVFGPMVDIKSTLMFLQVFRPRAVLYLVLLPLLMTLIIGVFINYFGGGW